ncbi:MAG: hypothetical protein ABFR89_10065, partial [Actinomycetota bacterium]
HQVADLRPGGGAGIRGLGKRAGLHERSFASSSTAYAGGVAIVAMEELVDVPPDPALSSRLRVMPLCTGFDCCGCVR